jgi:c-di-GMP-binding flagellar brake protein YcgR
LTNQSEAQKRSDYRTETSYPIWYRDFSDRGVSSEWVRAVTRDLSGGGASFDLPDVPPRERKSGDLLEIQVIVPPTPVFAIGRIVRVFQDERGYWCAGVMFASIEPRDKDRIVRAVLSEGVGRP